MTHLYMWKTHLYVTDTSIRARHIQMRQRTCFIWMVREGAYTLYACHIRIICGTMNPHYIVVWHIHRWETHPYMRDAFKWDRGLLYICVSMGLDCMCMCDVCGMTHTWLHVYVWHVWHDSYVIACVCVTCVAWLIRITNFSYARDSFIHETWFLQLRVSIGLKGLFSCDMCGMTHSRYTFLIYTCMDGARSCVLSRHICIIFNMCCDSLTRLIFHMRI